MAVRLALWGGVVPLAMALVLVSKPHVQVLTLRFIITRFGDVPETLFLTKASARIGSLTVPRLAGLGRLLGALPGRPAKTRCLRSRRRAGAGGDREHAGPAGRAGTPV